MAVHQYIAVHKQCLANIIARVCKVWAYRRRCNVFDGDSVADESGFFDGGGPRLLEDLDDMGDAMLAEDAILEHSG